MKPYIAVCVNTKSRCCFLCVVKIALHYCRTANTDFTLLTVRHLCIVLRINDSIICIRKRNTDTALTIGVIRSKAGGSNTLCCSVALSDLNCCIVILKELINLFLELYRKRVASAEHTSKERKVKIKALAS